MERGVEGINYNSKNFFIKKWLLREIWNVVVLFFIKREGNK